MITNNALDTASTYTDLAGLENIKLLKDEKQALSTVAKQFEGIFLNMMLKSMRAANETFSKDSILSSDDVKFYQNMLDNQLSLTLSQGEGMGLAKMLVRQLSANNESVVTNDDHAQVIKTSELKTSDLPKKDLSILDFKTRDLQKNEPLVISQKQLHMAYGVAAMDTEDHTLAVAVADKTQFDTPREFIDYMLPIADKASQGYDIDPRLLVAQAALETGWGRHQIQNKDGTSSFNLFGIKANNAWAGDKVETVTTEFVTTEFESRDYGDSKATRVTASFRSYSSYNESFQDYMKFVNSSDRYRNASEHAHDPQQYIEALHQAGYATDPQYADKIMKIYSGKELQQSVTNAMTETPIKTTTAPQMNKLGSINTVYVRG